VHVCSHTGRAIIYSVKLIAIGVVHVFEVTSNIPSDLILSTID
jgi:hypothetical protein